MEWLIFTTLTALYSCRFLLFAFEFIKPSEPLQVAVALHDEDRVLGRLPGEISINDMSTQELDRYIRNLQRRGDHRAKRHRDMSEKVNWKEDGF